MADESPEPASKPARRWDPTKAYGTITPPLNGAVYDQDGAQFNADGALVHEDRPPTPPAKRTSEVTEIDADGKSVTTLVEDEEPPTLEEGDPKDILKNWITGGIQLPFMTVRNLVKKAYSTLPGSGKKEEIVAFLVNDAALVSAESVKV